MSYCLNWNAGASAVLEIFSPGADVEEGVYQLKYTPPFRTTIRPPLQRSNLGIGEFNQLDAQLETMVQSIDVRAGRVAPAAGAMVSDPQSKMEEFGGILYGLTIPRYIGADLEGGGLFLEIGMDESLLGYPWELMHDGDNFLCLKHNMGRFVNATSPIGQSNRDASWEALDEQEFSVLVVAVPKPLPRAGSKVEYEELGAAEAEAGGIIATLTAIGGIKINALRGKEATYVNVKKELDKRHQIVHFCGHAQANEKTPANSKLILYDQDMTTGAVTAFVSKARPMLCFVNACESGKVSQARGRINVYGLARAFLETGSYLLGSRWKVGDKAAKAFGTAFYTALLKEGKPLGRAVLEGRMVCKEEEPHDFAWASYVLYGDPRVSFIQRQ